MKKFLTTSLLTLCVFSIAFAASKKTIESITPPPGYNRLPVSTASFAASLRNLELSDQKELLLGDGKTVLCEGDKVAVTTITPFDNQKDSGVDGILKLWGEFLWNNRQGKISFPLDNGQVALWKDYRDGLRPKKISGRYSFTQVTTPNGSYGNFQKFLAFVSEEMGALSLKRESTIILEDSLTVGDLIVTNRKNNESSVAIILDACKGPRSEKLYLLGTCGSPSTSLYIMRPYSPVQGLNEWFTLDGAMYAIGQGEKTDLRRVTLSK